MTNETMLQRLEEMCKCKYDLQFAAHMSSLKDDLGKEIKAAQKDKAETEPSTSTNKAMLKLLSSLKKLNAVLAQHQHS